MLPGVLGLLHAAFSALEHRAFLKANHEPFDGLPVEVRRCARVGWRRAGP